jgi:hypothetical protein
LAFASLGVYCLWRARESSAALPKGLPGPSPGPSPGPVPLPQRVHHPLGGDNLPLVPGMRYFAAVSTGFPASVAASPARIQELASKQGFVNVFVAEDTKPAWYPGSRSSADYFIQGDYRGVPTQLSRKPGPGVEVLEAFVL